MIAVCGFGFCGDPPPPPLLQLLIFPIVAAPPPADPPTPATTSAPPAGPDSPTGLPSIPEAGCDISPSSDFPFLERFGCF